jgi:transposase
VNINIPEGTFIRFLNDFFNKHIDVKAFEKKRHNDLGGKPAKHCLMMLKIIFYAFSMGIYSMRELSKNYLMKHMDFIYLSGNQYVDHVTLSRFLNLYKEETIEIFTRTVYVANNLGYIRKDLIAIDSTMIRANASIKFTGNKEIFAKKKPIYEKMISNLLERSKDLDKEENQREKKLIETERGNIERTKKNYENALEKIDNFIKSEEEKEKNGEKESKKQKNLTDPDSNLLRKGTKMMQGYRCQSGISETGIMVTSEIIKDKTDNVLLEPMVRKTEESLMNSGIKKSEISELSYLADKGYANSEQIGTLSREGYDLYTPLIFDYEKKIKGNEKITLRHCRVFKKNEAFYLKCPGGQKIKSHNKIRQNKKWYDDKYQFYPDNEKCKKCNYGSQCYKLLKSKLKTFVLCKKVADNFNELEQIRIKMKSKAGRKKYHKRFYLGEFGFGIIKEQMRFKKFLVRGLDKVTVHWKMINAVFNMKRIWVLGQT